MAQFKEGPDPRRNTKGRPPGTTEMKRIRQVLTDILSNNLDKIQEDLDTLTSFQRLQLIERLMKYVVSPPPPENLLDGLSDADLDKLIDHIKKSMN